MKVRDILSMVASGAIELDAELTVVTRQRDQERMEDFTRVEDIDSGVRNGQTLQLNAESFDLYRKAEDAKQMAGAKVFRITPKGHS
jgi:hypothetical protein